MVFLFEESSLRGSFDKWMGSTKSLSFYCEIGAVFRENGFGGFSILGRHPIGQTDV
jgi:hypothetical protein